jgi:hypothetical protein
MRSWLAPAPSTRTRILAPEPGRDLPEGRGQHLLVVGEGVRAGVAGPQQHGQGLAGVGAPGPERVEAVAFLPGGSAPSLSEYAVISVASMSMTSQPARAFPAMTSHGNPAGVPSISFQTCARILARACAILVQRGRIGQVQGAADRGRRSARAQHRGRWASTAMSLMLVAPSAIATAIDTSAHAPVDQRERALPASAPPPARRSARLVGQLPQQDRAGVPDQALPVRGDLQPVVPPVMLHGEERSSPGDYMVW